MTILASTIINKARLQLIDTGAQPRWSDAEMLGYISDGQRTMVAMSPSINAVRLISQLAAGAKQSLPSDAHMLIDITRNFGMDGVSPGRAVRIIERDLIDSFQPTWTAAPPTATVQNYIYDPEVPTDYYVYPPSTGNGKVELVYAQVPVEVSALTDPIAFQGIYQTAVFYYVMFRAHSKDNDFGSATQAASYMSLFTNFVSGGRAADLEESPNQELAPPNLSVRGSAQ